ncbi:MAG: TIGR04255 family protein [Spirochaetota bacterium]
MASTRKCALIKLSKQPIALVLIQARFSPISNMDIYIPAIQDNLRRLGYPLFSPQKTLSLEIGPESVNRLEQTQWRFEQADRRSSVIVDGGQILLQTSSYDIFEQFIAEYRRVFSAIMAETEHLRFGVIQRLGLRYIDQVFKQDAADSIDSYLRPELQGMSSPSFYDPVKRYAIAVSGKTELRSDQTGKMVIRVTRDKNENGIDLPSDVFEGSPERTRKIADGDEYALIDMDHFWEGGIGPGFDIDAIEELFYRLHDKVIEALHGSVVTVEGIKKWE